MVKLLSGEDGRIVRDENRTGQEIRKGDTLEKEWHRKKIIELLETATERELTLTYQFLKQFPIVFIQLRKHGNKPTLEIIFLSSQHRANE